MRAQARGLYTVLIENILHLKRVVIKGEGVALIRR